MTDTIQLDRATAERILASLMGCHETTAGSYSYLLINICDLSHALAAQPVQPAPLSDEEIAHMYQNSTCSFDFARQVEARVRTGGAV